MPDNDSVLFLRVFFRGFRGRLPCIDRVAVSRPDERLNQHSIESFPSRFTEHIDADGHPFVAILGLIFIRAQQPISPGQIESEVGVCLVRVPGMVNPVHVRRNHQPAQNSVEG